MGMFEAYKTCINKYAVFSGRARRSEYWFFSLCNTIVLAALYGTAYSIVVSYSGYFYFQPTPTAVLGGLYSLFIFLPNLAVTVRRLHDTGKSGFYLFLYLIPLVGSIVILIWLCIDSEPGTNQYGENPKYTDQRNADNRYQYSYGEEVKAKPQSAPDASLPLYVADTNHTVNKAILIATCISGPIAGQTATGKVVYVGRDPNLCQLVFPQDAKGISRVHCMLVARGDRIEVRDMNSTYGTYYIDGRKFTPDAAESVSSGTTIFLGYEKNIISVTIR